MIYTYEILRKTWFASCNILFVAWESVRFSKKSTSAWGRYQKTVVGQVSLTRILAEKERSRLPTSNQRGREDEASLIMRSSYEAAEEGLRLEMLCVELRVRPIYSLRTTYPLQDRNFLHPLAALEGDNTKFLVKMRLRQVSRKFSTRPSKTRFRRPGLNIHRLKSRNLWHKRHIPVWQPLGS